MTEIEELQLRVERLHLELRNYAEFMERKLMYAKLFQQAVIDELVVIGIYSKEHDTDPRKALNDAIAWNVDVALDPKVSKAARMLIEMGLEQAAKACEEGNLGTNYACAEAIRELKNES